ncbi:hypothetical protein QZH41_004423 [Actinostola sp. cb2023]|nr:hypothetical protein QZH41_004423 [Actinostola sp. cb2023]
MTMSNEDINEDDDDSMYFIHEGQVEVVSEHEIPIVFDTMGSGRFFGEISIVFSCPRTASIRTKTNCDVFVLTKADLDEVLTHYPLIKTKILETAEERQRMVAERAAGFAAKKKEEEDRKRQEEEDRKRWEEENKDKEGSKEDMENETQDKKADEPAQKPQKKAAFQDHPLFFIVFNYVCEASFYLEIFFNCHMAYVDNVGDVITDHKRLVLNYVRGKFPFDLLASFPIDLFALAAPTDRKLEILSYLRLLHLLRLVRMEQFSLSTARDLASKSFSYEWEVVTAHMGDQEIPLSLQDRVRNFYEFIWNTNKGVEYDSLFHDMPQCMNGELCTALTGDIISNIPLFSDADLPFIRLLATKARPCQFHANEYISRKGDIGQEMYLIKRGLVEVVTEEHPPEVIETLDEGSFFGEKSLVISTPRNVSVRAATHVDIFLLKKEDLDEALKYYAEVKAQISEKVYQLYGVRLQ